MEFSKAFNQGCCLLFHDKEPKEDQEDQEYYPGNDEWHGQGILMRYKNKKPRHTAGPKTKMKRELEEQGKSKVDGVEVEI
ncbi:MAG: hypothetical protein LPK47_06700, partial [Bacteroidota bacterium]|nr:hypothetical protein [Bacteroidota bacterium]